MFKIPADTQNAHTSTSARSTACQADRRRREAAVTRETLNHFTVTTLGRQGSHMGGRQEAEASRPDESVKTWLSQSGAELTVTEGRKRSGRSPGSVSGPPD